MSLFHIANDGNTLTMMSVNSGYTIERKLEDLPGHIQLTLHSFFNTEDLSKPSWTRTGVILAHNHDLYLWFLFEKSEEIRQQEQEPAVDLAMSHYLDMCQDSMAEI